MMKATTKALRLLLTIAVASGAACGQKEAAPATRTAETRPAKTTFTFDDTTLGVTPKGFTVAETKGAGTPAKWNVEAVKDDAKRKNGVRVETANKEVTFNLLLTDGTYGPDVEVSVDLKPVSGEDDQGGGLVWRAKDGDNYYVTRWNPLEKNIRLYRVEGALRTQLKSADLEADGKQWHTIAVTQKGAKIAVTFDGKEVLAGEDATFKTGGKVGLWTKADASSWFDNLAVTTLK